MQFQHLQGALAKGMAPMMMGQMPGAQMPGGQMPGGKGPGAPTANPAVRGSAGTKVCKVFLWA